MKHRTGRHPRSSLVAALMVVAGVVAPSAPLSGDETKPQLSDGAVDLLISPIEPVEQDLREIIWRAADDSAPAMNGVVAALALMKLGQPEEAIKRLDAVTRPDRDVRTLSGFDLGLLIAAVGRIGAASPDDADQACASIADRLLAILQDPQFDAVKRIVALEVAYQCGQFGLLRRMADPEAQANIPFRVRELAALSWSQSFWQIADGKWLSAKRARAFRRLACNTTRAFEFALDAAPSEFEKVRLAAHWSTLIAHSQFDCDSPIMRQPLIDAGGGDASPAAMQAFRGAVRRAVNAVAGKQGWAEEQANVAIEGSVAAFKWWLGFDPPKAVVGDVTRDAPAFIAAAFGQFVPSHSPGSLELTMRWYLWQAGVHKDPSPAERRVIDRQTHQFATAVRGYLNLIAREVDDGIAVSYRDRFIEVYEAHRDNRFFPYFRHAKAPRLWADMHKTQARTSADLVKRFKAAPPQVAPRPMDQLAAEAKQHAIVFCQAMMSDLWFAFSADDRPWRLVQLPDAVIYSCGGYLYESGVYVFDIGGTRRPEPFQPNKGLTRAEHQRSTPRTQPAK